MRILVVTNMYPGAGHPGFGIFVARQVDSLRRLGVDVHVETIAGDRGRLDYLLGRARIGRRIAELRPDVVHAHFGFTAACCVRQGAPLVMTLHGDDINGRSDGSGGVTLKSRLGVVATLLLCRGARCVISQNERMAARVRRWAGVRAEVIPNGVDEREFSPGSRSEARARLGLPAAALVLCFVNSGRQPTKRLDLAQATHGILRQRGLDTSLLVAETVPAGDMPWYYRAADCLLMTSDREGSPTCVKEALACGIPVVAVPVGDLPELLTDARMGRVVARDPQQLADAVLEVTRNGKRGASLLPPELSASSIADRLVRLYQSVAG